MSPLISIWSVSDSRHEETRRTKFFQVVIRITTTSNLFQAIRKFSTIGGIPWPWIKYLSRHEEAQESRLDDRLVEEFEPCLFDYY